MKFRPALAVAALLACGTASAQLFPTGKVFDLQVGVGGSEYDRSTDSIVRGTASPRVGFSTFQELFDTADSTNDLRSVNPAYTNTSSAVIRMGYRGLPLVLSTPQNSSALTLIVPALEGDRPLKVFNARPTRDENMRDAREFLKTEGGDILNRLQNALARTSPVDPIAGNPSSLQTQMVTSDFDNNFTAFASNVRAEGGGVGATNNLIGVGAEFSSFSVQGVRNEAVTVPISYTTRNDLDPRRQLTIHLPVTVQRVEDAVSASIRVGGSFRYPINDNWALTPAVGYGITGSADLGSVGSIAGVSLTSQYTFRFQGLDFSLGNAIGHYQSTKLSAEGYSFDPKVRNTVFRNGVLLSMPASLMGRRGAYELSYINTIYNGTELYSNKYNEIGVTVGTNRSANVARSYLRAGLSLFKGEKDIKGGKFNIGYWF